MKRSLVLFAAAVLLAAGCTSKGTTSGESSAPAPRAPVAAIVAVREPVSIRHPHGFATLQQVALWRVPLATGTPEAIPVRMEENAEPRLSPDGTTLLYRIAPPRQLGGPPLIPTLHRYDLASGTDARIATLTATSSFGWSREGSAVVVTYSTDTTGAPALREQHVSTVTVQVEGEPRRTLSATRFAGEAVGFLGADDAYVYLSGHSTFQSPNHSSTSIWQLPREGAPSKLKEISMGWGEGEMLLPNRTQSAVTYSDMPSILPIGVYVAMSARDGHGGETITPGLSSVDLFALPGMLDLRSIPVTPPPGVNDDRRPVFDDSFSRYLVTTWRDKVTDLWESDALGHARMLVSGNGQRQGPVPLGYVGEDFLYRSIEASRVVVRLYQRGSGTSRVLGDLGEAERTDPPYGPQTVLLGFEYR